MGSAPIDQRVGQRTVNFGEAQLFTPGDDGLCPVLPEDSQKIPCDRLLLAMEGGWDGQPEHSVAATGQPADLGHVSERDGHNRFTGQLEARGQHGLQLLSIAEKVNHVGGRLGVLLKWETSPFRVLAWAQRRPKVRRHQIHLVRQKFVRHKSSLLD